MASNAQLPINYTSQYFSSIGKPLYLNEETADFHFVFETDDGQSTRIPAHKNLLIGANEVFRVMFNGLWDENKEVKIVDASVDAFMEFLQFFYFTDIKMTMENIAELIYLGKKYNVADCLKLCTKFLKNTLNEDNICSGYKVAIDCEQEDLKKFCKAMIGINTKTVFASDGFMKCDPKVLSHIVGMDRLSCTCMRRVEAAEKELQSNQNAPQIEIRSLFKGFRFGSMSFEELAALSSHRQHFSYDEYIEIVQMIHSKEFQPTLLNGERDKRIDAVYSNEMDMVECNRLLSTYWSTQPYYIKDIETTTFSTNQPILLKEILSCSICSYKSNQYLRLTDLPTEVTIVQVSGPTHSGEDIILCSEQTNLKPKLRITISLEKPILIKAGFMYEIRMKQSPPVNCCTGSLLMSEVQIDPDLIVQFHNDPKVDKDEVARGLIYYLGFIKI